MDEESEKLILHLMKAAQVGHSGVASISFRVSMNISLWNQMWNIRIKAFHET